MSVVAMVGAGLTDPTIIMPAGAFGALGVFLYRSLWRQDAAWNSIVQAERTAVEQARLDASAARSDAAAAREDALLARQDALVAQEAERRCQVRLEALEARLEALEASARRRSARNHPSTDPNA